MTRTMQATAERPGTLGERVRAVDWGAVEERLSVSGVVDAGPILTPEECRSLAAMHDEAARFRHRVEMARHRFGEGEYQYFARPLPALVEALREAAYPPLAAIANRWQQSLGDSERFPATLGEFLEHCRAAGQGKPTPLLLRYGPGGYNCLHQDLYGAVAFPIQVVCLLDRPGVDYDGGEFVVVEQRPRAQSAAEVVRGTQGALICFTTRTRPARGSRGFHRVNVRHGVSRVHRGTRHTLGVIFHDAR